MKAYTDIEQSKKLTEILPLESADMRYFPLGDNMHPWIWTDDFIEKDAVPCWSLAALLGVLPYPSLHKTFSGWRCDSYNKEGTTCKLGESTDNPIDACYETIMKLHELKML